MTVRAILKGKGAAVVTAVLGETLHRISQLIAEYRIGAVLILDSDGRPGGIVSERDIVNALSAHGAGALSMTAAEAMTRNLPDVRRPDNSADEILAVMTHSRVRHLAPSYGGWPDDRHRQHRRCGEAQAGRCRRRGRAVARLRDGRPLKQADS